MATNISLNRRTGLPASTAGQGHENVGLLHNGFATFEPAKTDADIVVVAADVDVQARGVKWASETFNQPFLYCAGKHEFYKGHIDHTLRKMPEAAAPHVHVLENQVLICNQTRILVSTVWTDFTVT